MLKVGPKSIELISVLYMMKRPVSNWYIQSTNCVGKSKTKSKNGYIFTLWLNLRACFFVSLSLFLFISVLISLYLTPCFSVFFPFSVSHLLPFSLSPFLPFSLSPFLPFSLSPFLPFSLSPFSISLCLVLSFSVSVCQKQFNTYLHFNVFYSYAEWHCSVCVIMLSVMAL